MSKAKGSIQFLLDAEAKAAVQVKDAKKNRLTKQKQARDDADKEIQKIRATSEQKFTQYKNEHLGTTTEKTQNLDKRKQQAISQIKSNVEQKKDEVLDFMLNFVLDVDTQVPNEQKIHIERMVLAKQ